MEQQPFTYDDVSSYTLDTECPRDHGADLGMVPTK